MEMNRMNLPDLEPLAPVRPPAASPAAPMAEAPPERFDRVLARHRDGAARPDPDRSAAPARRVGPRRADEPTPRDQGTRPADPSARRDAAPEPTTPRAASPGSDDGPAEGASANAPADAPADARTPADAQAFAVDSDGARSAANPGPLAAVAVVTLPPPAVDGDADAEARTPAGTSAVSANPTTVASAKAARPGAGTPGTVPGATPDATPNAAPGPGIATAPNASAAPATPAVRGHIPGTPPATPAAVPAQAQAQAVATAAAVPATGGSTGDGSATAPTQSAPAADTGGADGEPSPAQDGPAPDANGDGDATPRDAGRREALHAAHRPRAGAGAEAASPPGDDPASAPGSGGAPRNEGLARAAQQAPPAAAQGLARAAEPVPRAEAEPVRGAPGLERLHGLQAAPGGMGGPDGAAPTAEARAARPGGEPVPEPFQQVADRTLRMARLGDRDATLRLVPEHLGEVRIHITVERGTVSADLTAHNHLTRHLLESHQGRLQQALLDGGADGARVSVSLGGDQNPHAHPDPRGRGDALPRSGEAPEATPEPELPELTPAVAPAPGEGALSIRA